LLFLELLQLLSLAPRDRSLLADPLQPPELLQGLAVELLLALDAGRVEEPRVLDRLPKIFERNVAVPVGVRGLDENRSFFLDRGFLGENGVRGVVGVEFVRTPVFGRDFFLVFFLVFFFILWLKVTRARNIQTNNKNQTPQKNSHFATHACAGADLLLLPAESSESESPPPPPPPPPRGDSRAAARPRALPSRRAPENPRTSE
jgi:hypothetical protein